MVIQKLTIFSRFVHQDSAVEISYCIRDVKCNKEYIEESCVY